MLVRETLQRVVVHQEEIGKWSKKGEDASEKKKKKEKEMEEGSWSKADAMNFSRRALASARKKC